MKILIVTQTVDIQDPILGFFVRWIEEFAKNCEEVHVLALNVGSYTLPDNVFVHGLGKSEGKSKIVWLWRLWRHSFTLRHHYDAVFVHMNPEYIIYGTPIWKSLYRRVGFWYAHGTVSKKLKFAHFFSNFVFTSTEKGFRINSKKRKIVGQGIDTKLFSYHQHSKTSSFLELVTIGRISKSKKIETLLKTALLLQKKGIKFKLLIYGHPQNNEELVYKEGLITTIKNNNLSGHVSFAGPLLQKNIPSILHNATIFIQDGQTGSLDKVLLEGISCGIITISSNKAYRDFIGNYKDRLTFTAGDSAGLAEVIIQNKNYTPEVAEITKYLRNEVDQNHSVENLINKILKVYAGSTDSKK